MNRIILLLVSMLIIPFFVKGQVRKTVLQEGAIHYVEPLVEVNTAFSEICPAIVGDDMYFSLSRTSKASKKKVTNGGSFYDEFKVTIDDHGKVISSPMLIPGFGNNYHEGPVCYCPSTGELYTTMSRYYSPDIVSGILPIETIKLSIVVKKEEEGKWVTQKDFQYNLEGYNVAHPAINTDGDTLFFVSDMPGGYGGNDIYYCVRTESGWGKPNNLGHVVNTEGDEMFPCLTDQGQLFFSSDGFEGQGGLDLYYVNFPLTDEKNVYALKSPVNSSEDDFGLTCDQDRGVGYFSSNRKGGAGSDDLYVMSLDSIHVDLIAVSSKTGEYLANTEIVLKVGGNPVISPQKTGSEGRLSVTLPTGKKYVIEAKRDGYKVSERNFDLTISNLLTGKYTERINLDPEIDELEQTYIVSDTTYAYNPYYVLFDFDRSTILPKYIRVLQSLAKSQKETSCLTLLLGGHTDSEGTDEYNQKLSERRAGAVKNLLVSYGADPLRLRIVGYGETRPMNFNGTEEGMAENRRVDFTNIVESCTLNVDSLLQEFKGFFAISETDDTHEEETSFCSLKEYKSAFITSEAGYYQIQLGAFRSRPNAEKICNALKTAFPEFDDELISEIDGLYKVRIGHFTDRLEAVLFGEEHELKLKR